MSPEEFADLEKESYLNAVTERARHTFLTTRWVSQGLDGTAAWYKASVEYDEKYDEQLAYDIELNSRLAAERGRQAAVIAEAQENQNKFYSRFDNKYYEEKEDSNA